MRSMANSKRITFRLGAEEVAKLQAMRARTGCADTSSLLRLALSRLEGHPVQPAAQAAPVGMPATSVGETPQATKLAAAVPSLSPTASMEPKKARATVLGIDKPLPPELADLLPGLRAHGTEIWRERRKVFQRLVVAAAVAAENGENPRDISLYGELLRVGRSFGLVN